MMLLRLNEKGRLINDELQVAETLNSHYINIVKTSCGQTSQALGNPKDQANDITSVDAIINNYKNHSSINQIRKEWSNPKIHSFPEAKNSCWRGWGGWRACVGDVLAGVASVARLRG